MKCYICGQVYDRFAVKEHIKFTHFKMRPLKCKLCDAGFTKKINVETHMKKFHNGQK